tara:strand:- start:15587 stop:16057 length:471 start_codon:yes stop_codon:yes gene_type:complete
MTRSRLDKIDKNILKILQEDGRVTNVDLAKSVGISAPPCLRRVRVLQESGYIKGYFAKVDPVKLGFGVNVYAMVTLKSQAESDLVNFESYITEFDMVRECHMLAGDVDFMLKVVAKSWDDYQEFLTAHLTSAPNVVSVKSSLSIRSSKSLPGIPIE